MQINKITVLIIFFLLGFISQACSDIIELKNGRSIKGLIKSEDEKGVELDLGFGTVWLTREEIERIDKSSPQEAEIIHQEWQRYKKLQAEARPKKQPASKEIQFSKSTEGIIVNALLNKKTKASLVLDTGASVILLSPRIGRELGLEASMHKGIIKKVIMADGSQTEARLIVLESVDVEGIEAEDVEAAVLLKEGMQQDGLLGRSFLNKFNFQIDSINKKLILNRHQAQDTLETTRYFSITHPADWESSQDEEKLIIFGPTLLLEEETEFHKPYIIIEKDLDERALNSAKAIKEWYNYWQDSPDVRQRMSGLLGENFKKSSPQVEFISSDFQEKKGAIILSYLFKEHNRKVYSVKVITKDEPLKSYNLEFVCLDAYFDKYLPVFSKCLESFTVNE